MDLLRSTETHYVVVASPRHDTVAEATFFTRKLHEQGLAVSALVVNRLQPRFGTMSAVEADSAAAAALADGDADRSALWLNLAALTRQADAEEATLAPLFAETGDAPVARVSLRADDVHDLAGITAIAHDLAHPTGER
jgi:anion-transporting  ArsA/GET3 family ATPase